MPELLYTTGWTLHCTPPPAVTHDCHCVCAAHSPAIVQWQAMQSPFGSAYPTWFNLSRQNTFSCCCPVDFVHVTGVSVYSRPCYVYVKQCEVRCLLVRTPRDCDQTPDGTRV